MSLRRQAGAFALLGAVLLLVPNASVPPRHDGRIGLLPTRDRYAREMAAPTGERDGPRDVQAERVEPPRASRSKSRRPAGRPAPCDLATIKARESHGNYQAVNPNGHYGSYQFDQRTWSGAVARAGSPEFSGTRPDQAPPEVQDAAAAQLFSERGSQPWSVCGR